MGQFYKPDELPALASIQGESKANQPMICMLLMTFLAGAYIAIGGFLALRVGGVMAFEQWAFLGKLAFGALFPVGLLLVVICGGDLFTGNCMTAAFALQSKRITWLQLGKSWALSWVGNFVGALFVVYALAYWSGLIFEQVALSDGTAQMPMADAIVKIANTKCNLPFAEAFLRGVGCNWLVCLAVYVALSAKDIISKIVGLWLPVMTFVVLSMEHCIANMFFVPLGLAVGTDPAYLAQANAPALTATWGSFFSANLLPVTLGNIVGGALLIAMVYHAAFPSKMTTP